MKLLAALAASLSFSLAVVAVFQGFADLAGGSARGWMRAWEEGGALDNAATLDAALERLVVARRLNPLSADYRADLGHLMQWQAWRQRPKSEAFENARATAARYYLDAIERRPSWGYAWAYHAENELLGGNSSNAFRASLQKAIELSPWEPGVQRKVAWLGMASWDSLSAEQREYVEKAVERAVSLDVHRHEIVRLAAQYGWLSHLEPMMRTRRQIDTLEFVLRQIEQR